MATTKRMKIEGKPVRPYNLYRIGLNDEIIELVLRADTLEELEAHRRRPDWKYAIYQNRKKIAPPAAWRCSPPPRRCGPWSTA